MRCLCLVDLIRITENCRWILTREGPCIETSYGLVENFCYAVHIPSSKSTVDAILVSDWITLLIDRDGTTCVNVMRYLSTEEFPPFSIMHIHRGIH